MLESNVEIRNTYKHSLLSYNQERELMNIQEEIKKRRTFAIISHPDAGKTTITEQLLYFGGEIREAGTVKERKQGLLPNLTGWISRNNVGSQ